MVNGSWLHDRTAVARCFAASGVNSPSRIVDRCRTDGGIIDRLLIGPDRTVLIGQD